MMPAMMSDPRATVRLIPPSPPRDDAPDVTVIIASHQGRHRIQRTLDSLERQTLDPRRFEVVVVVNGADDGTVNMLAAESRRSPVRIRVVRTPTAGFANARNLGIQAARGAFVTWVDDDDWVSPEFLATMLSCADPGCVVLPIVGDVADGQGTPSFDNYINQKTLRHPGRTVSFDVLPTAASFDSGKLVATAAARTGDYDQAITSGVDVLYWSRLILQNRLSIRVVDPASDAIYYREVRTGSVSRRTDDRFIEDRLLCIHGLEKLRREFPTHAIRLRGSQWQQAKHLGTCLRVRPERRAAVLGRVRDLELPDFPYAAMNHRASERLVVSCAFPPVNDTSGLVVARRLLLAGEPFDVVTQAMATVRQVDLGTMDLVREHQGGTATIEGDPSFGGWPTISRFATTALERVATWEAEKGPYPHLYSRAMWPAAHVLAAAYKLRHPETAWTAEFSDPLLVDTNGRRRVGALEPNGLLAAINHQAAKAGHDVRTDNLFAWVESITYALADRIWFTNPLQRTFMLERAASAGLADRAMAVSEINPHPGVPRDYYSRAECTYTLDPQRVNLGYFGVFYPTRGIGDLLATIASLPPASRRRVALHVFTSKPDEGRAAVAAKGVGDCVRINPYLPYLEFLNLAARMDWLVVADARAKAIHGVNPYLPSKYAEYRDSGSRVWAIVEPGSMLSTLPVDAATELGDTDAAATFLRSL
jgi:glycosyltransferase involved in cell wall biosynthesis